jgi:alkane 1-monooxygenase
MYIRYTKYCMPLVVFALAAISFTSNGLLCFLPVIYAYGLIPLAEICLNPDKTNLNEAEEELAKKDKVFDWLLYLIAPLQYGFLIFFLLSLQSPHLNWIDYAGRVFSMGLLCGIFGINVGHELGHRSNKTEQWLAKFLLLSSQYMHFFIEHNKGHHKHVATALDPASAKKGESLFAFYPRTILFSYISAWKIANKDAIIKEKIPLGFHNEMVVYSFIQISFLTIIGFSFGTTILLLYLAAAALGIGLLETVNYIEHYGLSRIETEPGKFERAMPEHSWNSNHIIGRLTLFELSRHSDHHYLASRKYQILRHFDNAPQMPTGYPGMMVLAHIPPLFFYVMHKQH